MSASALNDARNTVQRPMSSAISNAINSTATACRCGWYQCALCLASWRQRRDHPGADPALRRPRHAWVMPSNTTWRSSRPPQRPQIGAIAIANPIQGDRVQMTNHHWSFSISALRAVTGLAATGVAQRLHGPGPGLAPPARLRPAAGGRHPWHLGGQQHHRPWPDRSRHGIGGFGAGARWAGRLVPAARRRRPCHAERGQRSGAGRAGACCGRATAMYRPSAP